MQDAVGEDFLLPYGEFLQRGGGLAGRAGDKYVKYPVRLCDRCRPLYVTLCLGDVRPGVDPV